MFATDRNLGSYLTGCLTDAQTAFTMAELGHQTHEHVEKRRERRFRISQTASIYSFNPRRVEKTPLKLLDVSSSGLGISTAQPLHCGSEIQVLLENALVLGEVRYCAPVGHAFHSGIRIESVLRWSRSRSVHPVNSIRVRSMR
jgi:hypothetical protein